MPKPNEYVYIQAWHASTGSLPYYWQDLQNKASQQNAPVDALYYESRGRNDDNPDGKWHLLSELSEDHPMRKRMENFLREI